MEISILGAGTWGTAIAHHLSKNGHSVTIWSALKTEIDALQKDRKHPNLPGMELYGNIKFTSELAEACKDAQIIVFAVASVYIGQTARNAAKYLNEKQILVDLAKGIDPKTFATMSQTIEEEIYNETNMCLSCVALSGPTHAEEVAIDLPTAIVSACKDHEIATAVQQVFSSPTMRVYTNEDVLGVEICGAIKNIIALAAGISAGIGYGDNARAALITRGMTEIARLGRALGCSEKTFYGLAGVGDLIVTATSTHSRNNRAGYLLGTGMPVEQVVKEVGMVVEGLYALEAAVGLCNKYGVDMPIVQGVYEVVKHRADPKEVVYRLMTREYKNEATSF